MDTAIGHFGQWGSVVLWVIMGAVFLFFTPFYKAFIRHPQYTGFMLITLGMLFDWATLPMLIMWPLLAMLYYRLAKKEEADMQAEFGKQYEAYKHRTGRFLPRLRPGYRPTIERSLTR